MMRITLLGTGSSAGTPQLLCGCPVCLSENRKNMRTRFSILIETGRKTILVDAPAELRLQLLSAGVKHIDAVWLTHAHSDHMAGIDDLRMFAFRNRAPLPFYGMKHTLEAMQGRFEYMFEENGYCEIPFLEPLEIKQKPVFFSGLKLEPIVHAHGDIDVASFRLGNFAFLADFSELTPSEKSKLEGLDCLVISTTVQYEHHKHMQLSDVLALVQELSPKRTVLTHMNHHFDYEKLEKSLPLGVEPGFDGMEIEV